jgi:TDG/mug DNA glycosylase family protein
MLISGPSGDGRAARVRPSRADLEAARDKALPDVAAPGLRVLFSGINPGLYSAATGYHFARPGNRFWPALYRSGFTPRLFVPSEQEQLLKLGLGITNVAARATARADELSPAELRAGGLQLRAKVEALAPQWLAVAGVGAFAAAFERRGVIVGPQDVVLHRTRIWVLPNPSGLNAHYTPDALAAEFARLRDTAG